MRWEDLFADLEAQLSAAEAAELAAEVADRTRYEVGRLRLVDRLLPALGAELSLHVSGLGAVRGQLRDAGPDWLLLDQQGRTELLLPTTSVLALAGLGGPAEVPSSQADVARRLDLRMALKGLVRSRSGVQIVLTDGAVLTGTLDRVGADHVDLAEHAPGEARRPGAVRQVRLVPLTAVGAVRSWG
jgi:hypothetical protein